MEWGFTESTLNRIRKWESFPSDKSEILLWEDMVLYHQNRIDHSYIPNLRASFKAYDAVRRRNDTNTPNTLILRCNPAILDTAFSTYEKDFATVADA